MEGERERERKLGLVDWAGGTKRIVRKDPFQPGDSCLAENRTQPRSWEAANQSSGFKFLPWAAGNPRGCVGVASDSEPPAHHPRCLEPRGHHCSGGHLEL